MMYDLFADFYEKSSDSQPKYKVLLGRFSSDNIDLNEVLKLKEASPNHLEYVSDEVAEEDLLELVQRGYTCELNDVLNKRSYLHGITRILLRAMIVDESDESRIFPTNRVVRICDTCVRFEFTDPDSPVFFEDMTPGPDGGHGLWFRVPVKRLKRYFNALTLTEVMEGLKVFGTGQFWTINQLRRYFASGIDEAIELANRVYMCKQDQDGNPAILHALAVGMAGKTKDEKIVGFLHNILNDGHLDLTDLFNEGFSSEVRVAVARLQHERWCESYESYIIRIAQSGKLVINVKVNDLQHAIMLAKKGRHKQLVKQYEDTLARLRHFEEMYSAIKMAAGRKALKERVKQLEQMPENAGHWICEILEKYSCQKKEWDYISSEAWAEDEQERELAKADYEWGNDGKPTGIESDEEFERIQCFVHKNTVYPIENL